MTDELERDDGYVDPVTKKKGRRLLVLGVLFALVLGMGFSAGVAVGATGGAQQAISSLPILGDGLSDSPDTSLNLSDFWKVYNVLNARFVQTHASSTPATRQGIIYGAIQGLTAAYGDPYTVFFPPEQAKMFQEDISGNFGGVGAVLDINKDGNIAVVSALKNSPAARAGLKSNDVVLAVNGKSTDGVALDEVVKEIRGPKGTVVDFTILRGTATIDVKITRDTIQVPTIDEKYDAKNSIYTISLYEFTANSAELFDGALKNFRASGAHNLIIDLRGNPGGYLDAAVSIGSHFLPSGTTIVTEDYKGKSQNIVHKSTGSGGVPEGTKVVVLIDQGSASASEILAGALQDNHAATLVGTRSFGKGSVQELVSIGKASLKVTVARWLTPSGRSISDGGLTPDVKVERSKDDSPSGTDTQMNRAVQFITTGQ